MEKRSHRIDKRSRQSTSRTRTHERPNQGVLSKVASWFFKVWNSATNEEHDSSSSEHEEDAVQVSSREESEFVSQPISQSSKRPRLRLHDHSRPTEMNSSTIPESTLEIDYTSPTTSRGIKRLKLHEHSIPGCSTDVFSEAPEEPDYATTQHSSLGSKRQRLKLPDHNASISKAETEMWLDIDRPNIYSQVHSHMPSSNAQNSLIENKDSSVIVNGDDHSENSEGSASTSGCSSLVSHKDRINCMSSIILGESDIKSRRYASLQKGKLPGDLSSNRLSLWSTGESSTVRSIRSPSILQSGQPGFSLSAFVGSSKPNERKVASPFYHGKTTFGGASASRRMPISAAPYQVGRSLINQVKLRSIEPKDSFENMSSAARRILQTLEKMSSPVIDAKKIPNTNKSPVDLSLFLMPPKHRRNLQSTPAGSSKGPPIADISTISKLTTIKSYGQRSMVSSILDSSTILGEETSSILNNVLPQIPTSSSSHSLPSGGGKIRTKLNQHHQPSARSKLGSNVSDMESRMSEYIDVIANTDELPDIALPITSLPTIKLGSSIGKNSNEVNQPEKQLVSQPKMPMPTVNFEISVDKKISDSKQSGKDFVFSEPIEYSVPASAQSDLNVSSVSSFKPSGSITKNNLASPFSASASKNVSPSSKTYTFSNPIELENPICSAPSSNTDRQISNSVNVSATWECNSCWVRNPASETKCKCCETPKPSSSAAPKNTVSSASISITPGTSMNSSNSSATWECSSCWVRNPATKTKCACCDTPNPKGNATESVKGDDNLSKLSESGTPNSTFGSFKIPIVASSNCAFGSLKIPTTTTNKTMFGSLEIPSQTSSASTAESVKAPSISTSQSGFSFGSVFNSSKVPPVSSSWECDVCFVKNVSDKLKKCVACDTLRLNKSLLGSLSTKGATNSPLSSLNNDKSITSSSSSETLKPSFSFGNKGDSPNPLLKSASDSSITNPLLKSAPDSSTTNPLLKPVSVSSTTNSLLKPVSESSITNPLLKSLSQNSTPNPLLKANTPTSLSKTTENSPCQNTLDKTPSSTFKFGVSSSGSESSASTPVFQFGSKAASNEPSKQCSSCQNKSEEDKRNCSVCHTGSAISKPLPEFGFKESLTFKFSSPSNNVTPTSVFEKISNSSESKSTPSIKLATSSSDNSKSEVASSMPFFGKSDSTAPKNPDTTKGFSFGVPASSNSSFSPSSTKMPSNEKSQDSSQKLSKSKEAVNNSTSENKESAIAPNSVSSELPKVTVASTASVFQFGSQSSSMPLSFQSYDKTGSPGFSFGVKADTTKLLPKSSESPAFENKLAQPTYGNPTPVFKKTTETTSSFTFASNTVSTTAPVFQFGSTTPSEKSSNECSSCKSKSDGEKKKCTVCHPVKSVIDRATSKAELASGFQAALSSPANIFQFGGQSSDNSASTSAFGKPNTSFSFGGKSEASNQQPASQTFGTTPSQTIFGYSAASTFGKSTDAPGGFNFGASAPLTTTSVFQFGSTVPTSTSTWECASCHTKNENDKQKCKTCNVNRSEVKVPGFTFKQSNEIKSNANPVQFNAPTTTTASSSGFTFNATPASSASGFVFGLKSEPTTTTSTLFKFGSGIASNTVSSTPLAPYQFGSQAAPAAGTSAPLFGAASNTFSFGAKTDTVNPLQSAAPSSQLQTPAFGNGPAQPMFGGNVSSPAFGNQTTGGFNFGQSTNSNAQPVFQFGAEKEKATRAGFSFGTPSQDTSGVQPQFNISTPPSFNFGATSTPGPFQFAASSDNPQAAAPARRIRKALRRMK